MDGGGKYSQNKKKTTTNKSNKVKNILYSSFRGNEATRYGIAKEDQTIDSIDYVHG